MAGRSARILAISGGVGGAKLALGFSRVVPPSDLLVCANTADDFTHLGLRICPDLDTVMYTLAGINDQQQGWGLEAETWACLSQLELLGGEHWFRLGDRDLATHILRTKMLGEGRSLSEVTRELCQRLGVSVDIVPMTDQPVATRVQTDEGELPFQDYFVRRRCEPRVSACRFEGIERARVQDRVQECLQSPDLEAVVICPSNPFVSVAPVLALPGLRELLRHCAAPVVAVSPIVDGQAIKGPAAKMMAEMRMPASALEVGRYYADVIDGFVIDERDRAQASCVEALGLKCLVTRSVMKSLADREQLALDILSFCPSL